MPAQTTATLSKRTHILGHRGARGRFLENCQAGFLYAQSLAVPPLTGTPFCKTLSGVEFDIQLTKDGKLAVFHDPTLDRLAHKQAHLCDVSSHALKDVRLFDARHHRCEKLLFLDEMLPLLAGFSHIELEIKTHARTHHHALIHTLATTLSRPEFAKLPISLTSFDVRLHGLLHHHHALQRFARGLLIEPPIKHSAHELITLAARLGCARLGLHFSLIDDEITALAKRHRLPISAWTVNDTKEAVRLMALGIDTIISDVPDVMLALGSTPSHSCQIL
ncbi:hypothetical protein B0181_09135 [Moraxella caviae]|uniref:GP-PDE domain-containing protein n=1 Tax=Moraxella caviae TaxID=34060 RepID=A0A1S9ZX69_9GAMM|nr:hypothetical protein B0181_09135 [Moraxella caviae]